MANELITIQTRDDGVQTVSARDLYNGLEISDRFNRWFESLLKYGFEENIDFTSVKTSTLVNNGAKRELDDYAISIDMAKQICMIQRSEKGKQYREYFLELEKAWNSPEAVMARALQVANHTLEHYKDKVVMLEAKNEALASDTLTWADRSVVNACVRKYAVEVLNSDFAKAWNNYKKELLYKYSINLNLRKTRYINDTGKKTVKTLDLIEDDELPNAIKTAIALCEENKVNIDDIIASKLQK